LLPKSEVEEEKETVVTRLKDRLRKRKEKSGILVRGADDILVRFGKCCTPLPGDPVVGYITRGQGVTVHRNSCLHAHNMDPERRIELEWSPDASEAYPVKVHVLCHDKIGLLANITAIISETKANIIDASVKTRSDRRADCYFTVTVSGADHLEEVMKSLKKIKQVIEVNRLAT
jgi:GTP pyrophosphokinase